MKDEDRDLLGKHIPQLADASDEQVYEYFCQPLLALPLETGYAPNELEGRFYCPRCGTADAGYYCRDDVECMESINCGQDVCHLEPPCDFHGDGEPEDHDER